MKIDVNLDALFARVEEMGADNIDFTLITELPELEDIDARLKGGISVSIEEVEILDGGLLSYHGRQVLLYIQDHGWKAEEALNDGSKGKKYHVAYCSTLEDMKKKGKYDRYVAKNTINEIFFIDGKDTNGNYIEGKTNLKVCKNCLAHLRNNYNDKQKFETFSLEEFFKQYQSHFKHTPKYLGGQKPSDYPPNWDDISKRYRESVNWCCEKCHVGLKNHEKLLDTHHKNGVKHECQWSNLKALCKVCHANEHSHMKAKDDDKLTIERLREEQQINLAVI